MSDANLDVQSILNAVSKLTQPFRTARTSSQELAAAVNKTRDALKSLDTASAQLANINTLNATVRQLDTRLDSARLRAQMMTLELSSNEDPTKKQTQAVENQWRAVSRLEKQHQSATEQLSLQRAELNRIGISSKDVSGATEQVRLQTAKLNNELTEHTGRLARNQAQQATVTAARNKYGKVMDVRSRIAGASSASKEAGTAIGNPILSAVESYAKLEYAMNGVSQQVDGMRDSSGNRTDKYADMQASIKAEAAKLPLPGGAVDYAALVESGARAGVGKDAATWEEQKSALLAFASAKANASMPNQNGGGLDSLSAQWTMVQTGADNVMSSLGETLRTPLVEMMSTIRTVLGAVQSWITANPELAGTLMKVAAAVAGVLFVAGTIGSAIASVLGPIALAQFAMSTLGGSAIPLLSGAIGNIGNVFSWLSSAPLTLLRTALTGISGILGFLLSPVGLVVAAFAAGALLIWKYWEPISAFLGGVVDGFVAAAGPISDAFAPLQPVFQWIGDKVQALVGWFSNLFTPIKFTADELNNAASMGTSFGTALAEGLKIVLHPLDSLKSGISWLLEKMGLVSKESEKLPKSIKVKEVSDGASQVTGGYNGNGVNIPAPAGYDYIKDHDMSWGTTNPPLHPQSLSPGEYKKTDPAPQANSNMNSNNAASLQAEIHIHQQPGQNSQELAAEVTRQLDEYHRRNAANMRGQFYDRGEIA